jgi:rhodanese-related sulfurtransferase
MLKNISAREAHAMLDQNAVLVDVREPYEQAAERIPGSIELPLSRLAHGAPANLPEGRAAVFLCASGARTTRNSAALAAIAGGTAYCLAGGILAWKQAGFPTTRG